MPTPVASGPATARLNREFDERTARSALTSLWLAVVIVGIPVLIRPESAGYYGIQVGVLLTVAVGLSVSRRWLSPRLLAGTVLGVGTLGIAAATWLTGGPSSPAYHAYAVVIVGGIWLVLPPWQASLATAAVVVSSAAMTSAAVAGLLPSPWVEHTAWSQWLTTSVACLLLAAVQRLEVDRLRSALDAARDQLRRSEAAQQLAAEIERRYADVVATVPGMVYGFEVDARGARRFTVVSNGAQELFECAPERLLADAEVLFGMVDPPDQLAGLEASIAHSLSTLDPWEFEGTIRTPSGRRRWIRGHSVPARSADGGVRWHGVLTDISARKQAEIALLESQTALAQSLSLLQSAFDSTADGLLVVDSAGRVRAYNQRFLSLWRVPPAVAALRDDDRLLDHVRDQLLDPDDFLVRVRELYGHHTAVDFDTLRFKDGRRFERYSQPHVVDGTTVGRVWSFRDVTARHDAEQRRADLERQLQQAQTLEALGALAGGIAHDLNNVLTIVVAHAEQGLHERDDDGRRACFEGVLRGGERAAALVRQIREFSQPRNVERSAIAVADTIVAALGLLRAALPTPIEVTTSLDATVTMFANATQVQQVVTNLVLNAAQALGADAGTIAVGLDTVGAEEVDPAVPRPRADRYVRLTVRDTGPGIPDDLLPRIFEPFVTTKADQPGSGLGLAVVQGIVHRHGGGIAVTTAPGQGSRFVVYWPALAPSTRPAAARAPRVDVHRGAGRHVLLVDDEPEIARVLSESLRRMGYRVSATTDPRSAVDTFLASPDIDLVLTDLSMPGLSGVELGRFILATRPDTPVVLFTGYLDGRSRDDIEAVGFRAVLAKPMTPAILSEALHRALSSR